MPNQLSPSKKRSTYSEFTDVYQTLKSLALDSRTDVSQIVRNATAEYLRKRKHGVWVSIPYKSPAEVRKDTMKRISYTEWVDVDEELTSLAKADRLDKSDLLRWAVHTYISTLKK